MKISDFIRTLDRNLVEKSLISFILYLPISYGGKFFFYCKDGETVEDLCNFLQKEDVDVDITYPYNNIELDEDGISKDGEKMWKYTFSLENYFEKDDVKNTQLDWKEISKGTCLLYGHCVYADVIGFAKSILKKDKTQEEISNFVDTIKRTKCACPLMKKCETAKIIRNQFKIK